MTDTPPKVILLDIEGTTTSIAYVADVLFPYARARIPAWVPIHREELAPVIAAMPPGDPVATLLAWMDIDAKETALKHIQGRIWREGYEAGELKAHVYPDTPEALKRWTEAGIRVCIYSSGSIEAQKLIFGHSEAGDLTSYLSGYFDTTTGPKRDPESYAKIAAALDLDPAEILFVSDVAAETDAATSAGLRALLIDRDTGLGDVTSFAEILP
ncbi:acireductone synthase [Sphingomonas mali]|uniref:acireductone synthase n=1 Tax=Sphingomonas mali TaxID=40682 RepID=UPI000830A99F|nr:acireductone synthase [Sphingomonas mali]